jgi:hypothetical protein
MIRKIEQQNLSNQSQYQELISGGGGCFFRVSNQQQDRNDITKHQNMMGLVEQHSDLYVLI